MSALGVGVMISMMGGNEESAKLFTSCVGKIISVLELKDDALFFTFEDGTRIKLFDDGQSCCESRYMRTDDDLPYFVGATLMGAEVRDAAEEVGEYGDAHEIQFLLVTTSKGVFTMANHNEHNGYYGGFWVIAQKVEE